MKLVSPRRPRNPIAKAVRTPFYKIRAVENKRRRLLEKWSEAGVRAGNVWLDEPAGAGKKVSKDRLSPKSGVDSIVD
jgi:hypothetical protein